MSDDAPGTHDHGRGRPFAVALDESDLRRKLVGEGVGFGPAALHDLCGVVCPACRLGAKKRIVGKSRRAKARKQKAKERSLAVFEKLEAKMEAKVLTNADKRTKKKEW